MVSRPFLALLACFCMAGAPGSAHEFWIEPTRFQVETGGDLIAHLRNGQMFSGGAQAYFAKRTARFDLIQDGRVTPVQGRMGDVPALQATAPDDGLVVIVHQTAPSDLTYTDWDMFQAFSEHKDFPDIRARHLSRGLPTQGFVETYTRFAKALVGVGTGAGADTATGMETEFVARANPYADDLGRGFPVTLLYQGAPRGDAQVEVFDRAPDGTVTVTLTRTDADGQATIPVAPRHTYLLDAVVLREAPIGGTAVWETLWASLSFAVP
jgi:uncharacterized GH25 family protein